MIPLRPRSKVPAIKWEEFQERIATDAEISEWFAKRPDANLGIVTGKISGIVVVDADGAAGLRDLGSIPHSSTSVLTGRGRHLYFKYPGEEICNQVKKSFPGLDLRGDGGQAAAPPSVHENGRRYQWIGCPFVSTQSLPPFPLVMFATTNSSGASTKASVPASIGDLLSGLSEGNRNDTFARVIGRLHRDGWGSIDIVRLLTPNANQVGFDIGELHRIASSISRYPRDTTADTTANSDTLEMFLRESKPVEWIVPGIIARNSLGFVAGLPETGKTWLLIDLAIELARVPTYPKANTNAWLGKFPVNPATVLFIDQERPKEETQRRFSALLSAKGIKSSDCKTLNIQNGTSYRVDDKGSLAQLRSELERVRPDVCIIDSFATLHSSSEKDRDAMQRVMESLKGLRTEFKCSIILIEHENKSVFQDSANGIAPHMCGMHGSIAKPAVAEFVLTVRKEGDSATVYHTKSTMGKKQDAFSVAITDTDNGGISVNAIH